MKDKWHLLILYLLLPLIIYLPMLSFLDFWSDDFGYFLNFRNHQQNYSSLSQILISYLTGGVPRLQLAWHVTHQLLFQVFSTHVSFYFLIQALVLGLNSFFLYLVMQPVIGRKAAVWTGLILLTVPFYKESFYWVSANYGFFQLLFLLVAYLFFQKSLLAKNKYGFLWVLPSALSAVWATLYQEQSLLVIFLNPILVYLFNPKLRKHKNLKNWLLYFLFAFGTVGSLLVYQFLLIRSASLTSLTDTFKMYYPTPLTSSVINLKLIFRQTVFFFWPELTDWHFIRNNLSLNERMISYLNLTLGVALFFLIFVIMQFYRRKSKIQIVNTRVPIFLLSVAIWAAASMLVVVPIGYFSSRYVYFMLPPFVALFTYFVVRVLPKWHVVVFVVIMLTSLASLLAFYYGAHFYLVSTEKKVHPQIISYLKSKPEIKAIVFEGFPTNLGTAVSGVWLNYHATEWWLNWKHLPNQFKQKYVVGNAYYAVPETEVKGGFRIIYGDYPLERLQTVYTPEELLIIKFLGNAYDPSLEFFQFQKVSKSFDETVNLNSANPIFDFKLDGVSTNLQNCLVDVVADVNAFSTIGSIWFYSDNGKLIESTAHSSGLGDTEQIFSRTRVKGPAPYHLRFTLQPVPYNTNSLDNYVSFNNIEIEGCGLSYFSKQFVRTNNPDPQFPMIRWTSPQRNYSVTLSYPNAPMWENEYGIGVNDGSNSGDYFCFPDDLLSVVSKSYRLVRNAYLGMLSWQREIVDYGDKLIISFNRRFGDPLTQRGKLDKMKAEEFHNYDKDDFPLDITVTNEFNLNSNIMPVKMRVTSLFSEELKLKFLISDSPVMDFRIGSNTGMGSVILSNNLHDQYFFSTRPFSFNDFPIVYRQQVPTNVNLGALVYSCDANFSGSFLGQFDDLIFRNIQANIPKEVFEKFVLNKIKKQHDLVFMKKVYALNTLNEYDLRDSTNTINRQVRNRISRIFSQVNFAFPENTFYLGQRFETIDFSHGQHGLWFNFKLRPLETREITYYKIVISDWLSTQQLVEYATQAVANIQKEFCHKNG